VVRNQADEGPRHGPIYRAKLDFEQPRLFARPSLKFQSLLESERTLEQAYDAIGARARNGISWQPYSTVTIAPAYQLQGYWLNGPRSASLQTAPLVLGCKKDPCFILVSYLEEIATWDKRDSPLEPKKGHYLTLSVQEGGGPLQGDFDYLRIVPEARGYVTLGSDRWLTLAARLEVGTLLPRSGNPDDSAVVTRFMSGGAMSMRGFSLRRLSPMILAQAPASPGGTAPLLTLPIGGNGIIDGSFEARYSLTGSLRLAAFVDFGQVSHGPLATDDVAHLLWAVGVGVRYLTAIGPIRLDIARRLPFGRLPVLYALDPAAGTIGVQPYQADDSCFGIGGSHPTTPVTDSLCVLHISIGEAF
jgi:translocation and assembly module TamA